MYCSAMICITVKYVDLKAHFQWIIAKEMLILSHLNNGIVIQFVECLISASIKVGDLDMSDVRSV